MARGLFITGTGTGVGKTYIAALIARKLHGAGKRVGVYKPVASGCQMEGGKLIAPDAVALWQAAGRPGSLAEVCPQQFRAPLAPHLAARAEGKRVDDQLLRDALRYWLDKSDIVLVEGAGGLMSPLSDDDYNIDLATDFGFPLIVVSANELGTINATLQTLIVASTYGEGLDVAGIVLNSARSVPDDSSIDSNGDELARRSVAPLLAQVGFNADFEEAIDWWALAAG